ncbi:MAG: response regulator [Blautia sp.]|nr:response regulator [Blautia sp.]
MYKAIIAEDEFLVRMGVKMSINWESFGIEVVADVSNGKAALEQYEKHHPDLILTDIRMPMMDGMELMRTIREKDKRCRFIILSCLEEFDLVKEAISLDVTDYILKLTMSIPDMEKVLHKAIEELSLYDGKGKKLQLPDPLILAGKVLDFLRYNRRGMPEELRNSALPFGEKNLRVIGIVLRNPGETMELLRDPYGGLLSFAVRNVLAEILEKYADGMVLEESCREYYIVAGMRAAANMENQIREMLETIRKSLKRVFMLRLSFGVSGTGDSLESLPDLYVQAGKCLEYAFLYPQGSFLSWELLKNTDVSTVLREKYRTFCSSEELPARCRKLLDQAEERLLKEPDFHDFVRFFTHLVDVEIGDAVLDSENRYMLVHQTIDRMQSAEDFDDLSALFIDCQKKLSDYQDRQASFSKPVAMVIEYIRKNYGGDLSLTRIAEYVELSPNYICSLFKKETGGNLTGYVMEFRINRAKELFFSTNMKSYEIAEACGFVDESYFSKSFKKVTGLAPSEFRKKAYQR